MIKVITYGTYDLLHRGHIRLLERAKALGDYLIVGVTADDYDKSRGKINVQQSLMERIEAVRATGLADEIIVEEYEGQKIDDIRRYDIDIFTVGTDWEGQFDYLNEYCKVIYLPRTEGVASSEIREKKRAMTLGLVGNSPYLKKVEAECKYVNGLKAVNIDTENYREMLPDVDAVYIHSYPSLHYEQIKQALICGKHVLCESPVTLNASQYHELRKLADERGLILTEAIKTAYATAYARLILLAKTGKIGKIVSVDATCTSLQYTDIETAWNSISAWGPTAILPVFQILGTGYVDKKIITRFIDKSKKFDAFTKIDFIYPDAVASIKVGKGVKSEGELIVSGTEGYIYVPAPWWKTDYFELRYEDPAQNKRHFYQLDGEGIRYELVAFVKSVEKRRASAYIENEVTAAISKIMEDYERGEIIAI